MLNIDRNNIEITQGDSTRFTIELQGRELPDGTRALFTVKATPWEPTVPEIERMIEVMDGKVHVLLEADETRLDAGEYVWDVRVYEPAEGGGTYVLTPMEYGVFRVLAAIGG